MAVNPSPSSTETLRGSCHCGALAVRYRYTGELTGRACQCTFCRRHGGITASDPAGQIRFLVRGSSLHRYRFGRKTTDFMLCRECGCYLGAMVEGYACVNLRCCLVEIEPTPMVYDGESAESRLERRKQRWSPADVLEVAEVPARGNGLLQAYYAELSEALGGFVPEPELEEELVSFLVLREEGRELACGGLKRLTPERGEVKRMFTDEAARGRGLARDLLAELEEKALSLGMREMVLDTAAPLHPAHQLYRSSGYREVERYNDNPYAAHWFAKEL